APVGDRLFVVNHQGGMGAVHCSGGGEDGSDRGWPEKDAAWRRHAWSSLDGNRSEWPEKDAAWRRHAWSILAADRSGWPERDAAWRRHAWSILASNRSILVLAAT